jgi:hypothetical protein
MSYPQSQQKQSLTFGGIQQNFTFNLRNFRMNDQFTIIENLPANNSIRKIMKMSIKPNARTGKPEPYSIFAIRISSGGFEADLELFEAELSSLAIACPKDIKNFKGVTLAFDGFKWHYVCCDPNGTQFDPKVPLNESGKKNQADQFIAQMVDGMKSLKMADITLDSSRMMKLADKISPGNSINMIGKAKEQGLIVESNGIFSVVE